MDRVRIIHEGMGLDKKKGGQHRIKLWQINQSNEAKTKNLEQDLEDVATGTKEFGWSKDEDNPRAWTEKKQVLVGLITEHGWSKDKADMICL